MISNTAASGTLPSLSASMDVLSGLSTSLFNVVGNDAQGSAGLGVSTNAAPLISAPVARQAADFQAMISPPTRPTNPAIAPPMKGADDLFGGNMNDLDSSADAMGFMAALKSQTTAAQTNIR